MIDLHCHLLPGIDDGAPDLGVSLAMARAFVDDGVEIVACTPHILPGLYHNTGPEIRRAIRALQSAIDAEGIPLRLTTGADIHITPDLLAGLHSGHLLPLGDTRYLLLEPPHHVAPMRMDETLFSLLVAGYVPVVTHPERLSWIKDHYATMQRLVERGVWMQITAGSLTGRFGKSAKYWAERMLEEGLVHILATDAHDTSRRPPNLSEGRDLAARRVGEAEAENLVWTRPLGILANLDPSEMALPRAQVLLNTGSRRARQGAGIGTQSSIAGVQAGLGGTVRDLGRRLRQFLH